MKRSTLIIALAALIAAGVAGTASYLLFTGPRMKGQPHIRSFDTRMPLPPAGTVPVEPVPLSEEAVTAPAAPLEATPDNVAAGRAYYQYYCAFCHGEKGQGDGPVGQSYTPRPQDLTAARVQKYSEEELRRAMFAGAGHEPVLRYAIPRRCDPYLALYVRQLAHR